jgi:CRISPR-associated protein Csd2
MATQKLILFKHDGPLGSAPSQDLFARVTVEQRADVGVPRSFADYCVEVRKDALPAGVEVLELR